MERILNQKEVAKLFGVSTRTLERHRIAGTGPRYTLVGKLVRYQQSDLDDFVKRNLRQSTSAMIDNRNVDTSINDQRQAAAPRCKVRFPGTNL